MNSVAAIGWREGNTVLDWCTATLVTPRVMITAAHCIEGLTPTDIPALAAFFGFDTDNPGANTEVVNLAEAYQHPQYDGDQGDERDIAVLILERDARTVRQLPFRSEPLAIEDLCLSDKHCPGRSGPTELLGVGYGDTSSAGAGGGVRRSALMDALDLDASFLWNAGYVSNTCFGDSGGPIFSMEEGAWNLWGVVSWGDDNCTEYGANSRVGLYSNWLLNKIEGVHGTRDPCAAGSLYQDGICDPLCPDKDSDCSDDPPPPEGKTCGCAPKDDSAQSSFPFAVLLPWAVVLRLRRN